MAVSQLIISGSIALDRIMNFSGRYRELIDPDKLHVLSVSVLLDKLEETPGGTGANIAYNAARLGDRPVLLGAVGPNGAGYLEQLTAAGIDTARVHMSQLPTASFNGLTDADNNQIGGFYPGAMTDSESLGLEQWAQQDGQGAPDVFVVVAAHDPAAMRRQVAECRQHGLRLMYDPGQQVSNLDGADLAAGAAAAEVLIVNDYELSALSKKTGTTPAALKAATPIVITTLGEKGSIIEGKNVPEPIAIAAATPLRVLDPTGAGDAYRAGFLHGYLRQWDLPACGQLGSVVASFVVEQHGTQRPLTEAEIIKRYRENFNEEIEL